MNYSPVPMHGRWGFESLQLPHIAHAGEGGHNSKIPLGKVSQSPNSSPPEKAVGGDELLAVAPASAGGWMHQTDKRGPRICVRGTSSVCYGREALVLRAMCQNLRHYLIQASQLPRRVGIIIITI